jgi:hypothetical protein
MSWAIGFDSNWNRDIGYGVPAYCDHPGCKAEIDRGLAYVCRDSESYGGKGCGLYFCPDHLGYYGCERCTKRRKPFAATPDHPEWLQHKLTDASWQQWRDENQAEVESMTQQISAASLHATEPKGVPGCQT